MLSFKHTLIALLSLTVVAGRPLLSERLAGRALEARSQLAKRVPDDYEQAFVGIDAPEHDAAVAGSGFISRTVLSESVCGIEACLDYCDSVQNCGMSLDFFAPRYRRMLNVPHASIRQLVLRV